MCCLDEDAARASELLSLDADLFLPGALTITGENCVPAIVCEKEAGGQCFVLARASAPLDAGEAAQEAEEDLGSSPDAGMAEVGPGCMRHLAWIGYRLMEGVGKERVALLDDLISEDDEFAEYEPSEEDLEFEAAEEFRALRSVVESQIRMERPPEVRKTFVSLLRLHHSRPAAIDMIADVLLDEMDADELGTDDLDIPHYIAALTRLPQQS